MFLYCNRQVQRDFSITLYLLTVDVNYSFTLKTWSQTLYVGLPWTRDRSFSEDFTSTTQNINRQTYRTSAGFEPAIPNKRAALHRAAAGIGQTQIH
jgi:hypothetical protein